MLPVPLLAEIGHLAMIGVIGGALMVILVMLVLISTRYKRCPSNHVLVIFGRTAGGRTICQRGDGAFVWPLIQDYALLRLDPIGFITKVDGAPTSDDAPVDVSVDCRVVIGSEPGLVATAADRLLRLTDAQIGEQASFLVGGVAKEAIAARTIAELCESRTELVREIRQRAGERLGNIGLHVIRADPRVTPATTAIPVNPW